MIDNKLIQALIAAATGILLGGGGMLQVRSNEVSSIGSGVEQIVIANAKAQRVLFEELSECREALEEQ